MNHTPASLTTKHARTFSHAVSHRSSLTSSGNEWRLCFTDQLTHPGEFCCFHTALNIVEEDICLLYFSTVPGYERLYQGWNNRGVSTLAVETPVGGSLSHIFQWQECRYRDIHSTGINLHSPLAVRVCMEVRTPAARLRKFLNLQAS